MQPSAMMTPLANDAAFGNDDAFGEMMLLLCKNDVLVLPE